MDLKSKIILISGPTASGKSIFAIKVAKKINGEIINADSMQVYKQLSILTARPKLRDQKKIKHHLYGFQSVTKKFSTGCWLNLTKKKIIEIRKRNKVPVLVGGTGLYFKSITEGLVKMPNIPLSFRNKIRLLQKKLGQKKFYQKLIQLDPKINKVINSNDVQRSIRAYEVKKFTKKSIVDWHKQTKSIFEKNNFIKIYLDCPRDILLERINKRTNKILKIGGIEEVKKIKNIKITKSNSSTKIIGISEIKNLLNKKENIQQTNDLIALKTRQYAKRQLTWARGQMKDWKVISYKETKLPLKKLFI